MTRPSPAAGEEGQATIEFALTLVLLLGILLFLVQLSLVFAFGNFAHYATFMSARAYLAAGATQSDQRERAEKVIARLLKQGEARQRLDRYPSIAQGFGGGGNIPGLVADDAQPIDGLNRDSSWRQGVRYTFRSRLFLLPIGKGGDTSAPLELTSESWLGREPTQEECQASMREHPSSKAVWLYDNGC